MKIWILKAAVQKFISWLPYKHKVNYIFQNYVTRGVRLTDELFETKLRHCAKHISTYDKYCINNGDFNCFELGTGWYPIIPVGLFLSGANHIDTADITSLVNEQRLTETIGKFLSYHNSGRLREILPAYNFDKIEVLKAVVHKKLSLHLALQELYINLLVGDVRDLYPESLLQMTLISSNNTFEHIPSYELSRILFFFKKIIAPDGIMSHFIDLSDHFSHLDKSISPYNFLKFSDKQWKWIDNSVQPQNRLRISDYRKLFEEAGWIILDEENSISTVWDVKSVDINRKYEANMLPDISVTHSLITAKPG